MGVDWYVCPECDEPTSDYSDVHCGNDDCDMCFCYDCAEKLVLMFGKSKDYEKDDPRPKNCYVCAIDKDDETKKFDKKIESAENRKLKLENEKREYIVKKYKENEKQ